MITLNDVNLPDNATVLLSANLDVPLSNGLIADDTRLKSNIPTIKYLLSKGCKVVITGHIGRPGGKVNPSLSTILVKKRLEELLSHPISFSPSTPHVNAAADIRSLGDAGVLLLENMYFDPRIRGGDEAPAKEISLLIDFFVNDAYCDAHRANSYNFWLPFFVGSCVGLNLADEYRVVSGVLNDFKRPLVVVLGGAKADKIGVINSFIGVADNILLGGVLANTFLKATGIDIKGSRFDERSLEIAGEFLRDAEEKFLLPVDVVAADKISDHATHREVCADEVPDKWLIADIGSQSIERYKSVINNAKTIIWGGPMGVFEIPLFSRGTREIACAVANSEGFSLVAGGDSEEALDIVGLKDSVSHVSIGGGATLTLLADGELVAVKRIDELNGKK